MALMLKHSLLRDSNKIPILPIFKRLTPSKFVRMLDFFYHIKLSFKVLISQKIILIGLSEYPVRANTILDIPTSFNLNLLGLPFKIFFSKAAC
jgi:hypothetical protein